jgi:hypothetical protein
MWKWHPSKDKESKNIPFDTIHSESMKNVEVASLLEDKESNNIRIREKGEKR